MAVLKQSTAYTRSFMMVATSDHIAGLTGATVTVKLSKAGGGGAAAGGTVTEVDSTNCPGLYKIALTTTDTATLGDLAFCCTATSADPTNFIDQVCVNILGDTLPANVTQWNGTNVSAPATAGIPEVNVKNVNNVSASSVTAVNANQGTTQPVNFTGTAGSALVKSDMTDIAGAAVSTSSAQIGVNVVNFGATAVTGRDIGASVLLSAGTGTGQLDFTSGVVKGNLVQILATALTETAGQIAAAFKQWFNVATPTGTVNSLPNAAPGASGGVFIAGSNATTTVNITGNITGNLSGSVGSVTGAVGSVTGNVGGNVVGSVASVTAGVTVTTNNDKTGYALTSGERTSVADVLLDRDMSVGTDSGSPTVRTVRQALRALRNKMDASSGTTLTIYKEDDSTASWTAALTGSGSASPIVTVDPA